jgi:lipoprotein-anchoring transpeptidase ErfK/SrfK
MGRTRRAWVASLCAAALLVLAPAASARAQATACAGARAGTNVRGPTNTLSWSARIEGRTAVYDRLPGPRPHVSRWLDQEDALAVLVVGRPRASAGGCWLLVRLPWRPNDAAGWVSSAAVQLQANTWRIAVSTQHRTLTLFRAGRAVRKLSVVVGKPSTPTPEGLFAIAWPVPWHPNDFLGSWVLVLTAHSNVLKSFEGGDGTVGIHGRGGASLADPLGSALSHGCVRLANEDIDWLVRTVGQGRLPGTPVQVS